MGYGSTLSVQLRRKGMPGRNQRRQTYGTSCFEEILLESAYQAIVVRLG